MLEQTPSKSSTSPDDAMNCTLEAEQRALDAIKDCEGEAAKLIEGAQQQARSLVERMDRRIRDLHLRCVRATADKVDAMAKEDTREAEQAGRPESEAKALDAAVERLAARLTGKTQASHRNS